MSIGGVYEILNTVNGKRYIGSAINLAVRERQHFRALKRQKHQNKRFQNAWNKHGAEAFEFRPLMVVFDPLALVPWEQKFIDEFKPEYNLSPTAGSSLGMKHSLVSRANMSVAQKGYKQTPEVIEKRRQALLGKVKSADHRAKIALSLTGKKASAESCAKRSLAGMGNKCALGYKHTSSAKEKIGVARTGTKRSLATREKLSRGLMGNTRTLGFKQSAETIEKKVKSRRRSDAYKRLMACQGALA